MFGLFRNSNPSETPIQAEKLQLILDSIITKELRDSDLHKATPYSWRNTNALYKHAIEYRHLKGACGALAWGVNLGFIPIVTKKIKWFKTDKSFCLHLFDYPIEYKQSFLGKDISQGISSHWSEKEAQRTISQLWENNRKCIFNWLKQASTLEGLIDLAENQVLNKKLYSMHHPSPQYILPFLYAKAGNIELARLKFDELDLIHFNDDEELKIKAREILNRCDI